MRLTFLDPPESNQDTDLKSNSSKKHADKGENLNAADENLEQLRIFQRRGVVPSGSRRSKSRPRNHNQELQTGTNCPEPSSRSDIFNRICQISMCYMFQLFTGMTMKFCRTELMLYIC